MSDKELIQRIYDRCPSPFERDYTIDQFVDRCQDIRDMIDEHNGKGSDDKVDVSYALQQVMIGMLKEKGGSLI